MRRDFYPAAFFFFGANFVAGLEEKLETG